MAMRLAIAYLVERLDPEKLLEHDPCFLWPVSTDEARYLACGP